MKRQILSPVICLVALSVAIVNPNAWAADQDSGDQQKLIAAKIVLARDSSTLESLEGEESQRKFLRTVDTAAIAGTAACAVAAMASGFGKERGSKPMLRAAGIYFGCSTTSFLLGLARMASSSEFHHGEITDKIDKLKADVAGEQVVVDILDGKTSKAN